MGTAADALLIITGSMGAGKTTVLAEASDILSLRGIPHAIVDLDALGTAHLPLEASGESIMYRNLQSVWNNYAARGLNRLLVARAMEDRAELERCRAAVSAKSTLVCRLNVSMNTMRERVRLREPGISQSNLLQRVAELETVLDRARLEDFTVANENRSVTDVAREMLVRAGWLSATQC